MSDTQGKSSGSFFERYALTSGELGSAGGQTLIAALLPVLLAPHAPSTFWIGAVIASEGAFALALPYAAGAVSDSAPRRYGARFGRRGRLLALAAPAMATGLFLIAALDGFFPLAGAAILYFAALHLYSGPLRALLIDATPQQNWGKVQGVMGATHVGGVAFGLVAGGLLYSIWEPLPFVVAGVLVLVTTTVTLVAARRLGQSDDGSGTNAEGKDEGDGSDGDAEQDEDDEGNPHRYAAAVQDEDAAGGHDTNGEQEGDSGEYEPGKELAFWRDLAQRPDARRFLIGNVLWNAGVEGIRPYIFLFATVAIGITVATASLAMVGFMVAAGVGSVLVGRFGDKFGRPRVLALGALVAGLAMMPGLFIRDLLPLMILLVPAGIGAAALISLPYPVFEEMVEEKDVGRTTGVFYMSVGMARLIAPLLVGAAIDIGQTWMPETEGYPIMWPVAGSLILAGVVFLQLSVRATKD